MRKIIPALIILLTICSMFIGQVPTGKTILWIDSLWIDSSGTFITLPSYINWLAGSGGILTNIDSTNITNGGVGNDDLASNIVTSAKIKNGEVKAADIGNDEISGNHIAAETVPATDLLGSTVYTVIGSFTQGHTAWVYVDSNYIASNSIIAADIATGAVTTAEILDSTIAQRDVVAGAFYMNVINNAAAGAGLGYTEPIEGSRIWNVNVDGSQLTTTGDTLRIGTVGADSLMGAFIDTSTITDGSILEYNSTTGSWEIGIDNSSAGGSERADSVLHDGDYVPGDSLITDAEASRAYQPLDAQLTDISDGTFTGDFVNTAYPWADNEVADNITASNYLPLATFDDSLAATNADTIIKDLIGTMVTGNTETNIFVTYNDSLGKLNFSVTLASAEIADSLRHDGNHVVADSFITDAEGDIRFQPLDPQLTDLADGTITGNFVNTAYPWADNEVADNITASNYLPLASFDDSLAANDNDFQLKSTIISLPFGTAADSTLFTLIDTLPCGYTSVNFTIDTVVVISYGTPDFTFRLFHSGSTAAFAAQTVDAKVKKFSSFTDATVTEGRLYVIPIAITTKPQKVSVQILGHY